MSSNILINGIGHRFCTRTVNKLNYAASFVLSCTEEYPLWRGSLAEQVGDYFYIHNSVSEFGVGRPMVAYRSLNSPFCVCVSTLSSRIYWDDGVGNMVSSILEGHMRG